MTSMYEQIDGHTQVIALIGHPVGHSLSPAMHNLSFEYNHTNAVYVTCDVEKDEVPAVIEGLKHAGFLGLNVTMPCKRAIIPCMDELTPDVEIMDAANVISFKDGKAKAYNSDGPGYLRVLEKGGVDVTRTTMTMLGAGGVASSVIVSAALAGMPKMFIFARKGGPSYTEMQTIIPKVHAKAPDCDITLLDYADTEAMRAAIQESDLLVNGTNVGMGEDCTDLPLDPDLIKPGMVVGETIYNPLVTQLMKEAEARNCKVLDGLDLMLEQGAICERWWLGIEMPMDLVNEKVYHKEG